MSSSPRPRQLSLSPCVQQPLHWTWPAPSPGQSRQQPTCSCSYVAFSRPVLLPSLWSNEPVGNKARWEIAYVVSNPLVSFLGCCLNKKKIKKRKKKEDNQGKIFQGVKNSYGRKIHKMLLAQYPLSPSSIVSPCCAFILPLLHTMTGKF